MNTPRRAGYREVWMEDPRMSFTHGDGSRRITLKRDSGGYVRFNLFKMNLRYPDHEFTPIDIDTIEKFEKLWEFLESLKEVE